MQATALFFPYWDPAYIFILIIICNKNYDVTWIFCSPLNCSDLSAEISGLPYLTAYPEYAESYFQHGLYDHLN